MWCWMKINWGKKLASWREPWEPKSGWLWWEPIRTSSWAPDRPADHMNTAALRYLCWWTGSELCVTSTKWRWVYLFLCKMPYFRPFQTSNPTEVWVNARCAQVENFTVSFSDGRVLCYLIHHYHPGLLSDTAVSLLTTQTVECSLRGRVELDCSASGSDNSFDSLPAGLNGTGQLWSLTLQLFFIYGKNIG